jgi:hypothetical protein
MRQANDNSASSSSVSWPRDKLWGSSDSGVVRNGLNVLIVIGELRRSLIACSNTS